MSKFNLGKKLSEETRQKMSKAHKGKTTGEKHYLYGKTHSEETKQKMSKAHIGIENKHSIGNMYTRCRNKINFINKKLGLVEYCTQYELYSKYNLSQSNLSAVVNKKRKSHKGWSLK